jgi:hypothetical protein
MLTNDGYALLIGVDDYSTFDASAQKPKGTSDLRGSRNDVRTFWKLCRRIGIKAENIRVLASPAIAAADLEGALPENVGTATKEEILDKAAWLGKMLAQKSNPTALMTYSGHGDWVAGHGLVLCPSDVTQGPEDKLAHAVSFHDLNERLAAHAENLTVVLDTCHSGSDPGVLPPNAAGTGLGLTLTGRPLSDLPGVKHRGTARELVELAGRVLAASRRDQVAYQVCVDGEYHGVFSWAVTTALGQWHATQEAGYVRFDVSYGTLVQTAGNLIGALWIDQSPELHGPAGVADLAVLRQGLVGQPGETVAMPDGKAIPEQLDPGHFDYVIYALNDNAGNQLGQVLVTATASPDGTYLANYEYWYMTTNLSNSSAVTFTGGASQYWSNAPTGLGALSFSTPRTPHWTLSNLTTVPILQYYNSLTGQLIGINWGMSNASGAWTGSITWWHNTPSNVFGANTTTTLSPGSQTGRYYYFVSTPTA